MNKPLVAGNWKMNGLPADVCEIQAIAAAAGGDDISADLLICPPNALMMHYAAHSGDSLSIGAQDCHANDKGAHTGDTSAALIKAIGCDYVIVGHSERRTDHGETSAEVAAKSEAAVRNGLVPIICIGETLQERESGRTEAVVLEQLEASSASVVGQNYVIAYEPVWAIGTGLTPSNTDIENVHRAIRDKLKVLDISHGGSCKILYGGSVKPQNAEEILKIQDVNGALVGGASLKSSDFLAIARAA